MARQGHAHDGEIEIAHYSVHRTVFVCHAHANHQFLRYMIHDASLFKSQGALACEIYFRIMVKYE